MARSFRNGCEWRGRENCVTKRNLPPEELRSLLRDMFGATDVENLESAADAWESAETPDLLSNPFATGRRAVFVLWAEPSVSFGKEIRLQKTSVNSSKALLVPRSLSGSRRACRSKHGLHARTTPK